MNVVRKKILFNLGHWAKKFVYVLVGKLSGKFSRLHYLCPNEQFMKIVFFSKVFFDYFWKFTKTYWAIWPNVIFGIRRTGVHLSGRTFCGINFFEISIFSSLSVTDRKFLSLLAEFFFRQLTKTGFNAFRGNFGEKVFFAKNFFHVFMILSWIVLASWQKVFGGVSKIPFYVSGAQFEIFLGNSNSFSAILYHQAWIFPHSSIFSVGLRKLHSACLEELFELFFENIIILQSFACWSNKFRPFGYSFSQGCRNFNLRVHRNFSRVFEKVYNFSNHFRILSKIFSAFVETFPVRL